MLIMLYDNSRKHCRMLDKQDKKRVTHHVSLQQVPTVGHKFNINFYQRENGERYLKYQNDKKIINNSVILNTETKKIIKNSETAQDWTIKNFKAKNLIPK